MEYDVRTPELGIKMCTAIKGEKGSITLVKKAGHQREEVPLEVFLGTVYKAVSPEDKGLSQHET